ncbi:unnamed protein product [Cuscuta epithymum]|uniref:Uncharacterized protein n=1 Tax=Cuscuta epithymum TaxID=186058 RepID=A0AAV0FTZ1_9ASTE|nr:unnamed protein product [Cuscuta epithymum]
MVRLGICGRPFEFNNSGEGQRYAPNRAARYENLLLGWVFVALLSNAMEVIPVVFYPGGTMVGSGLEYGADLDFRRLGGRVTRWLRLIWHGEIQIRMREKQNEELMVRPPPEPPPWGNRADGVRKSALLAIFYLYQSSLFCYYYFGIFRSNNKGSRLLFLFDLVDSFLYGGNQADSAVNILEALTFSAISLALFGVDYSMSDLEVRGPLGFWSGWIRGSYFIVCKFRDCTASLNLI